MTEKAKQKVTIEIDPEVWAKVGEVAKETGFKKAALAENILRSAVIGGDMTLNEIAEMIIAQFIDGSSKSKVLKKLKK